MLSEKNTAAYSSKVADLKAKPENQQIQELMYHDMPCTWQNSEIEIYGNDAVQVMIDRMWFRTQVETPQVYCDLLSVCKVPRCHVRSCRLNITALNILMWGNGLQPAALHTLLCSLWSVMWENTTRAQVHQRKSGGQPQVGKIFALNRIVLALIVFTSTYSYNVVCDKRISSHKY